MDSEGCVLYLCNQNTDFATVPTDEKTELSFQQSIVL